MRFHLHAELNRRALADHLRAKGYLPATGEGTS